METQPELVAHHYTEAGLDEHAIPYWQRAGERAVQLPAYAEAVRFYHLALQALDRQGPVDEAQRCSLLLALGDAQRKRVNTLRLRTCSYVLRTLPGRWGRRELLVRAGLELEMLTHQVGLPTAPAVRLLEEVLPGLGAEDSLLTAKTLGGLARALRYTGMEQQATGLRPAGISHGPTLRRPGADRHQPPRVHARPPGAGTRAAAPGLRHRRVAARQGGERARTSVRRPLVACVLPGRVRRDAGRRCRDRRIRPLGGREAATLPPLPHRRASGHAGLDAGPLRRQPAPGPGGPRHGAALQTENAAGIFGLQMFTLRREQGRLKELEPVVRYFVQQHPVAGAWRPGLALIYSELGRAQEARAEFEHLAQHDFADLPRDACGWAA